LETPVGNTKRRIRIKNATNLPTKAHEIQEQCNIDQSLNTRGHCAAVNRALLFQK